MGTPPSPPACREGGPAAVCRLCSPCMTARRPCPQTLQRSCPASSSQHTTMSHSRPLLMNALDQEHDVAICGCCDCFLWAFYGNAMLMLTPLEGAVVPFFSKSAFLQQKSVRVARSLAGCKHHRVVTRSSPSFIHLSWRP